VVTGAPANVGVATPSAARSVATAAKSAAAAPSDAISAVRAFVEKLKPYAEAAGRAAGLPGAYLLAQAGLETGWGRFQPRHADGTASNNLFGIKAGKSWTGAVVEAKTTEFVNGQAVKSVEKFRAYASQADALADYAALIGRNPRYAKAVASAADPAAFAQGLQKAGYATDPRYAEKLTAAMRMVARHTGPAAAPAQVFAGNAVNRT
jgi:flagellar protein FlgJ